MEAMGVVFTGAGVADTAITAITATTIDRRLYKPARGRVHPERALARKFLVVVAEAERTARAGVIHSLRETQATKAPRRLLIWLARTLGAQDVCFGSLADDFE